MACDTEFFETGMIVSIWDNFFTIEIVFSCVWALRIK